jgi:hypothetical protein
VAVSLRSLPIAAASKLLAPGRSRRLARPNWARNRGVVTHSVGRPAVSLRPQGSIIPVSNSSSIVAWPRATPRMSAISARVSG